MTVKVFSLKLQCNLVDSLKHAGINDYNFCVCLSHIISVNL